MSKRGRPSYRKIIYPNIERWMKENGKNISNLVEMTQLSDRGLRHILHGDHLPNKYTIDLILEATGLTYEEAFMEK